MAVSIAQIIGKINPKLYAENGKELLKKYGSPDKIPAEEVKPKTITYSKQKDGSLKISETGNQATHTLTYESYAESLEPVYFFIIDLMTTRGFPPEKLIDNFSSTLGSPYFSETGLKLTRMQDEVTKMMQSIGVITRGILNVIYDLKEWKIFLQSYDDLKSPKKETRDAALLSLKSRWMDKVDMLKGQGSINALTTGQLGFQTLRDAFLIVKDEKDVDKLDLNDRVKRILKPRIQEFNTWVENSGKENRKRYEIERNYLKTQVSSLKLYSRWLKPYLKTTQNLQEKEAGRNPNLVKMFNRLILELTLLGKSKVNVKDSAIGGRLPRDLAKITTKRDYYSCVLVDFVFRAVPTQGNLIGKAEITFRAYALNSDELKKLDEEMEKSDLGDALRLIEGATTESIGQMEEEINYFLEESEKQEEKEKSSGGSNPFVALFGGYNQSEKKDSKKTIIVNPDNWIEKENIRPLAAAGAEEVNYWFFDVYKKAHGMASFT